MVFPEEDAELQVLLATLRDSPNISYKRIEDFPAHLQALGVAPDSVLRASLAKDPDAYQCSRLDVLLDVYRYALAPAYVARVKAQALSRSSQAGRSQAPQPAAGSGGRRLTYDSEQQPVAGPDGRRLTFDSEQQPVHRSHHTSGPSRPASKRSLMQAPRGQDTLIGMDGSTDDDAGK